jgi:hypothetical protein
LSLFPVIARAGFGLFMRNNSLSCPDVEEASKAPCPAQAGDITGQNQILQP